MPACTPASARRYVAGLASHPQSQGVASRATRNSTNSCHASPVNLTVNRSCCLRVQLNRGTSHVACQLDCQLKPLLEPCTPLSHARTANYRLRSYDCGLTTQGLDMV